MEIIKSMEQGSQEWLDLRLGKVTASCFSKVIAKGRGNAPSKVRADYMLQLAAEIVTGQVQDTYTNQYMEWGTETEPKARSMYELMNDVTVEEIAFIKHSEHVGVSPDGLVGDNGLLEIKCPKTTTQIQRVIAGVCPTEYIAQIQGQLWVSGREWCDFVSYDPRIKNDASYFEIRVERDEVFISDLAEAVDKFLEELNEILCKL